MVINQSLCATANIHAIKTTIFKPTNLVRVSPIGFLIKWAIIKIIPEDTSEIATTLASNGGRPKYSTNPSGGNGNFPIP